MINLLKDNKELMKEYDFENNGNIDLDKITIGSSKKIWWICPKCKNRYESIIYSRSKGHGCPYCANQKVLKGYNDLATTNPKLAKEWNYNKNILKPDQITKGSNKIVWWICPKCNNSYDKSVNKRNSGENCPYCSGHRVLKGYNDLKTWCKRNNRKDLLKEFDKEKNSFDITEITFGSGKKIWWVCPNGHSYQATLHHRINYNTGCGRCSHKVFESGYNDLLTTNPEIAKEWDYKKNNIRPNEVMAGSNTKKYWFVCPKGHSYQATLLNRKKGRGCPKCSAERHTSFPEKAIYYYMSKYYKNVKENYHNTILGTKEIDIFLEDYKFGIEYDGRTWHKKYKRDLEKDKQCYKNGIELLRIREIGCTEYDSNSIKKYIIHDNLNELDKAIEFIVKYLNDKYKLNIHPEINTNRDRIQIMELMNLYEKNNSIADFCPEIKKYWDYKKNGMVKPEHISHASVKKIFLRCAKGHEWVSSAHKFSSSPVCPICAGYKTLKGYNDLFTTNPELKTIWSPNNNIDPATIRKGSNKKVLWICQNCGYEYEMMVNNKTSGRGCPKCRINKTLAITSKKVQQFSLDGKLIAEYKSASEAIEKTGITSIHSACRGRYKTAGGYIWKYKK